MTSELEPDLRYFGYKKGDYICKCKACDSKFLGAKKSWRCTTCAVAKSEETAVTRAAPDVPELVRYDPNGKGYPWFEMEKDEQGDYVLYSQAAAVIAAKVKIGEEVAYKIFRDYTTQLLLKEDAIKRAEDAEAKARARETLFAQKPVEFFKCDGCGRVTDDLEKDAKKLKDGNFLSCCPERKMVKYITSPAHFADLKAEVDLGREIP